MSVRHSAALTGGEQMLVDVADRLPRFRLERIGMTGKIEAPRLRLPVERMEVRVAGGFDVGHREERAGQRLGSRRAEQVRLHVGHHHRDRRGQRKAGEDLFPDDLAAEGAATDLRLVPDAVTVDVAVDDAAAVERRHVRTRPVGDSQGRLEERERIEEPLGAEHPTRDGRGVDRPALRGPAVGRDWHRPAEADVGIAGVAAPRAGDDHMTLRAGDVAPLEGEMDARIGAMGHDVRVTGKSGRELPLELQHPWILPGERDQPRILGWTAEELESQRGQGLGLRGGVHQSARPLVAVCAERPEDHGAPPRSHLGRKPARIRERVVHVLRLEPRHHAAVAAHRRLGGQPVADVVVLDHEAQPVERHLRPLVNLVQRRGLGAGALVGGKDLGRLVEAEDVTGQLIRDLAGRLRRPRHPIGDDQRTPRQEAPTREDGRVGYREPHRRASAGEPAPAHPHAASASAREG